LPARVDIDRRHAYLSAPRVPRPRA
jgi:hypothetical protein